MFFNSMTRRPVAATLATALFLAGCGDLTAAATSAESKKAAKKPPPIPTAAIHGRVLTPDGKKGVTGAVVRLRWLDSGEIVSSPPSANNGNYQIKGLGFGYAELVVETTDGIFVSDRIVDIPPAGSVAADFRVTPFSARTAEYWASRRPATTSTVAGEPLGLAETREKLAGRDFWKSPAGIAIIAGVAGAIFLAAAVNARGGSRSTTTSTPVP